ncbi:exosome complex component RRP42 [Thrips palmi]|uniref:Ribosomal RNA-processing protein 42 n=1 Tax=Thrips palmi TaxID=161013 RepID=A0A6P8Z775_THRPL|nr:exosome complex component RRP42 [Thrips palmi]
MAGVLLSEAEKTFILHGVQSDLRNDGRSRQDYRPIELELDIVTHANGSARVRLANTDVLVGVKTEIDVPKPEKPEEGKVEFFVDCSANATPVFEGKGGEELATEISNFLASSFASSMSFDLKTLCIIKGVQCWKLYVDILILECGGNLFDAVSLAVKAALHNTMVPRVETVAMDGGNVDLQLSGDPYDCWRLDTKNMPCLVTLSKIGEHFIVDSTAEEEECSMASLVFSVTDGGRLNSLCKTSVGSLHPHTLAEALKVGVDVGVRLNKALDQALAREDRRLEADKPERFGFLK